MKKNYTKAELTLILMNAEDIVATSGNGLSLEDWNVEKEDKAAFGNLFNQ